MLSPSIATKGIIPISRKLDTAGSFGRTVEDAVYGLSAITNPPLDHGKFLSKAKVLQGAKFGLPRKCCWDLVPPECADVAQLKNVSMP